MNILKKFKPSYLKLKSIPCDNNIKLIESGNEMGCDVTLFESDNDEDAQGGDVGVGNDCKDDEYDDDDDGIKALRWEWCNGTLSCCRRCGCELDDRRKE